MTRTLALLKRVPVSAWLGLAVLLGVVLVAALVPLWGYDFVTDVDSSQAHLRPDGQHWLGTDHLGRDVYWRLLWASRSFVGPGLLACVVAAVLGIPSGAVAGYLGGPVRDALRYGFTVFSSLPRFVLVLLVCSIYGDATWLLALAVGVSYTPTLGEAVYARVDSLRSADYVMANKAYGLSGWRILWVHLVGAAAGRLIGRHLLTLFGYFLVLETTLAYIGGFGVQEPTPSWGNMLVFEWGHGSWTSFLAPALAIWLVIAATSWLTEALGEVGRD